MPHLEHDDPGDVMRALVRSRAERAGLPISASLRLFRTTRPSRALNLPATDDASLHQLGQLYESILDFAGPTRKRSGSFYTPPKLAARVVDAAFDALGPSVVRGIRACDPALGGGVFLLELAERIERDTRLSRREIVERCLHGFDSNPLAVAVGEAVLYLWAAEPKLDLDRVSQNLVVCDALDRSIRHAAFDLVIGNPPWVAYAGRAAQPLAPELRARWAREFKSFFGYRTLHALFVERAAELAPNGVIALILPSPLADLAGYAPVRRTLAASHAPVEPMLEFGQDAFENVTQPCFALIARPGADPAGGERQWRLVERQRALGEAALVSAPRVLERLAAHEPFPRDLFGELGFQSAGDVAKTLFLRAETADQEHRVPLLEGRDVREFHQGPARLFMKLDEAVLRRARCRFRGEEAYRRVAFVVRQTAKIPIAALHDGTPFRNSLLAGFEIPTLAPSVCVALLNSTLYRALHVSRTRDARQAAFPQVKIAHLRGLPQPPEDSARFSELGAITRIATRDGVSAALRSRLDEIVFDLFEITPEERHEIFAFLHSRVPELTAPRARSRGNSAGEARTLRAPT